MKKFLLSAAMLLLGAVATFAQEIPDASSWNVGDEITNQVGWGNLSFEDSPMDYWQFTATDMTSPTTTGGAFEAYNNSEVDLFQYVLLPAGMYRVECQGYYRCGNSGNSAFMEGAASKEGECAWYYYNNKWEDNALLSVWNGTYDVEGEVFTPNHQFKTPLMPRLFPGQTELIHDDLHSGDEGYPGWDRYDYYYPELGVFGPTSGPGSLDWFNAGLYMPYNEGKVKYNTVTFFQTTDGYVKIGVEKKAVRSNDTFFVTNFKLYYEGPASEAADLMAAQDDCQEYFDKLQGIIESEEVGLIAAKLYDEFETLKDSYGSDPSDMDKATVDAALAEAKVLYEGATQAQATKAALESAIDAISSLVALTDYEGKATLEQALDDAQYILSEEYEYDGEDDWDAFEKNAAALYDARLTYLKASPKNEDGAWNFSALITTPFFCDTQYTPVWNAEANAYVFPTIEGVDDALQPENTWTSIQEQDYKEAKGDASRSEWIPIADNVVINQGKEVKNQWVIKSTTWHGGVPVAVTIQHGYPAVGGWTAEPSGNPELLYQTITGLPNGFYSMSALMCNAGADISDLQFVYIESGDSKATAPLTMKGNPWWGGNRDAWRSGVWEKLSTDMIFVESGELTIGSSSDAFYATTGFQLYYYGETPDYDGMIAKTLNAAKENAEGLALLGDKKNVQDLFDKIPAHITTKEDYLAAQEDLKAVTDYISKALAATGANWQAPNNFSNLAAAKEGDVAEFLMVAWDATGDLEVSPDAVYTDAIEFDNIYKAYESYVNYRESLGALLEDAAVAAVVSDQNAYLKGQVASVEKINEFKNALGTPVNAAMFAAAGADGATLENPVDVSFVLINPKFHEGHSKGWDCVKGNGTYTNDDLGIEIVKDGEGKETLYRTISEIWGASDPFVVSQTLNGLPAGTYEIRTHTLYRDGWGPDQNELNEYYDDFKENGADPNWNWKNNHAKVFAEGANGMNRQETPVSYIYSLRMNEPSFTYYSLQGWWEYDDIDNVYSPTKIEYLSDFEDETSLKALGFNEEQFDGNGKAADEIPFDKKLTLSYQTPDPEDTDFLIDITEDLYFSQRTIGLVYAVKADYNNYLNKLYINLPEGGSLTLGIDKEQGGGGCSLAMYDWELFYCGTEIPTAIDAITEAGEAAAAEGAVEYYSVNGVKLSAPQKGFNIIKKGSTVKKVYIQ